MAAQTCAHAQTATLSTTVADTITFTSNHRTLRITNHHATVNLFFRLDPTAAVTDADENFLVLPNSAREVSSSAPVISVVGNGNKYTVETW